MFRKLFKTESRPPERGVDQDCVEFMMGHLSGIESVGGIYDRTPELAPEVIEREYAKLEPFLNVFSNPRLTGGGVSAEDREVLNAFRDPEFRRFFLEAVKDYKQKNLGSS